VDRKENEMELLPGEDPSQASAEDAEHWVQVSQELLSVMDNLLEGMEVKPSASVDEVALARQRAHYVRRLAWWRAWLYGI
jgi:hypothetical protein